MKHTHLWIGAILILLLVLATVSVTAAAQTSAGFNLEWNVIGNGGGESSSAGYRANGTIGQNLVEPATSSSAGFTVHGGFWVSGSNSAANMIYLPVVIKN